MLGARTDAQQTNKKKEKRRSDLNIQQKYLKRDREKERQTESEKKRERERKCASEQGREKQEHFK